jgi:hypothetical protein
MLANLMLNCLLLALLKLIFYKACAWKVNNYFHMFFFKVKMNQIILTVIFTFILFKTLVIAKNAPQIPVYV